MSVTPCASTHAFPFSGLISTESTNELVQRGTRSSDLAADLILLHQSQTAAAASAAAADASPRSVSSFSMSHRRCLCCCERCSLCERVGGGRCRGESEDARRLLSHNARHKEVLEVVAEVSSALAEEGQEVSRAPRLSLVLHEKLVGLSVPEDGDVELCRLSVQEHRTSDLRM